MDGRGSAIAAQKSGALPGSTRIEHHESTLLGARHDRFWERLVPRRKWRHESRAPRRGAHEPRPLRTDSLLFNSFPAAAEPASGGISDTWSNLRVMGREAGSLLRMAGR